MIKARPGAFSYILLSGIDSRFLRETPPKQVTEFIVVMV